MNDKFELKYSSQFISDFKMIDFYITNNLKNNIAADNLLIKVEKEIKKRAQNPLDYEQYKTNKGNIYYRIYIKNYIVFYTVGNNIMEVRRIIYGASDLEKIDYDI